MSTEKPKAPTVLHMQRAFVADQADGVFYREKRGLLSYEIGGDKKTRTPAQTHTLLMYASGRILAAVGQKAMVEVVQETLNTPSNNPADTENRALLEWYARVAAQHGTVSLPAIAAKFQAMYASIFLGVTDMVNNQSDPEKTNDEIISEANAFMDRVSALCEAWRLMSAEIGGEHELAFAKTQHKASAAKGTQAVKDKKLIRNGIVLQQIAELAGTAGRKPSDIARRIRVKTLDAFKAAGLDHDYTDETFEKIVRRALS